MSRAQPNEAVCVRNTGVTSQERWTDDSGNQNKISFSKPARRRSGLRAVEVKAESKHRCQVRSWQYWVWTGRSLMDCLAGRGLSSMRVHRLDQFLQEAEIQVRVFTGDFPGAAKERSTSAGMCGQTYTGVSLWRIRMPREPGKAKHL